LEKSHEPLLKVEGICKRFPGVNALEGVSFDLEPGEVHALCGENGAGKSTLIKVLTGVHQKDEGVYCIEGKDAHIQCPQDAIDQGVACIYQEMSIVPLLDVARNLYLGNFPLKGGKRGFIDYKKLYSDAQGILDRLGVTFSPKAIAGSLSVGQQQMIEIGRALTRNARIIIMDEPTSSLSEKETDTLLNLIRTLAKSGVAIIYISHKLDEVMQISKRITILRDGQKIITVNTADITQQDLITHMLGRTLDNMYNKKKAQTGDVAFAVKGLARKGVFENISFDVHHGEVVGFFGLIGAGRTEIMRAIFGADKHDSGEVYIDSVKQNIRSPAEAIRNGIGFATEDRKLEGLALQLPILLNMTLVNLPRLSKLGVINRKKQSDQATEFMKNMSLKTPSLNQFAGNLSGGNQQKVVVAKWLMTHPKVLILDEPTRGIDVGSKAEIYALINDLARRGMAVILVSSEIEEIMGICDRVVVIAEGKQTATLDMEGLSSETILTAAFGGTN
jgi:ribose transport system ATP-binding protein